MPITYRCEDHPEWEGNYTTEVSEHIRECHAGFVNDGYISSHYLPMVEALGGRSRAIYRCRGCGDEMSRYLDEPEKRLCDGCQRDMSVRG